MEHDALLGAACGLSRAAALTLIDSRYLNRKKTSEKRPIAAHRKPKILGRHALFAIPLRLKFRPFIRKCFRQALHRPRDQAIRLPHRAEGFIHKARLDRIGR